MSQYVLSLSYGKDSLACLGAIEKLGWPLDRIVHAEIWATDTISADLPPMVEFKAKADEIIKSRWGLTVEHLCATRGGVLTSTSAVSTMSSPAENLSEQSGASLWSEAHGANTSNMGKKLTYQDIFYRLRKPKRGGSLGSTASPSSEVNGATAISKCQVYGFPISVHRGNWCTGLKTRVFFWPRSSGGRYKYCGAICRDSGRRTETLGPAGRGYESLSVGSNRLDRSRLPKVV